MPITSEWETATGQCQERISLQPNPGGELQAHWGAPLQRGRAEDGRKSRMPSVLFWLQWTHIGTCTCAHQCTCARARAHALHIYSDPSILLFPFSFAMKYFRILNKDRIFPVDFQVLSQVCCSDLWCPVNISPAWYGVLEDAALLGFRASVSPA